MPIYEFECKSCGKVFETLVLSKSEEVTCPQCGGKNLDKLISLCAISTGERFRSTSLSSSCSTCSATSCAGCKT